MVYSNKSKGKCIPIRARTWFLKSRVHANKSKKVLMFYKEAFSAVQLWKSIGPIMTNIRDEKPILIRN